MDISNLTRYITFSRQFRLQSGSTLLGYPSSLSTHQFIAEPNTLSDEYLVTTVNLNRGVATYSSLDGTYIDVVCHVAHPYSLLEYKSSGGIPRVEIQMFPDADAEGIRGSAFTPSAVQLIVNDRLVGDRFSNTTYTYASTQGESVGSFGYRFYYNAKSFTEYAAYSRYKCVTFFLDRGVWTFKDTAYDGGNIVVALDTHFNSLETKIDQSTTQITDTINQSTGQVTTAITDSSNRVIAAVTSKPEQNQAATQYKDDMSQTTTQIQDNVQAIEDKTNRPDPEKTAQDIDPLEKLDKTDQSYLAMKDGIKQILSNEFILTIMLMLFGFAFVAYVLFGKRV